MRLVLALSLVALFYLPAAVLMWALLAARWIVQAIAGRVRAGTPSPDLSSQQLEDLEGRLAEARWRVVHVGQTV